MTDSLKELEKSLNDLNLRIKQLEEKEDFFIVFDTYRIGLVGVVISCSGLIVALFMAFTSYRAINHHEKSGK